MPSCWYPLLRMLSRPLWSGLFFILSSRLKYRRNFWKCSSFIFATLSPRTGSTRARASSGSETSPSMPLTDLSPLSRPGRNAGQAERTDCPASEAEYVRVSGSASKGWPLATWRPSISISTLYRVISKRSTSEIQPNSIARSSPRGRWPLGRPGSGYASGFEKRAPSPPAKSAPWVSQPHYSILTAAEPSVVGATRQASVGHASDCRAHEDAPGLLRGTPTASQLTVQ